METSPDRPEFDAATQPTPPDEGATAAEHPLASPQMLPTDRPEVVRRAWALYDEARRGASGKPLSSAEELALRRQYLEVAAQEYLKGQAVRRFRLRVVVAVVGLLLLVGLVWEGWAFLHRPPSPLWYTFASRERGWALDKNPKTKASVSFATESNGQPYGILTIDRMVQEDAANPNSYYAGLITRNRPVDLSGYEWAIVYVRGEGMAFARPSLWASHNETFVGPKLVLYPQWRHYALHISMFTHNLRDPNTGWRQAGIGHPGLIYNVEIQAGAHVNEVNAQGKVFVGPIVFLPMGANPLTGG